MEHHDCVVIPIVNPDYKINPTELIKSIKSLPPFPRIAMKALDILSKPDYDIKELADVINMDQGITANVLRVCNSPYYSFVRQISSINQAIAYLGSDQVKEIIVASGLKKVFLKRNTNQSQLRFQLWKHSVRTAIMSQAITKKIKPKPDFTIYTAALLHDVGRLILDECYPQIVEAVFEFVKTSDKDILEVEKSVLGMSHSELGARLAEEWLFPKIIVEGIRYHHDPQASSEQEIASVINLANILAYYTDPSIPQTPQGKENLDASATWLGFSTHALEDIISDFLKRYERMEALINQ